jgi:PAS domain S-box-containing protein
LNLQHNQLWAILEHLAEGVIVIDQHGAISLANPHIEHLLNVLPDQLTGRRMVDLAGDALAERLGFADEELHLLDYQLREGARISGDKRVEYQLTTPDRRFIQRQVVPVSDDSGRVTSIVLIYLDVSEDHELRQTQEEVFSMVVHDLRSPLTSVAASLRLMQDIAQPDDPLGKVVLQTTEISSRALRKLLNLVNSLLDVARMESGITSLEREPCEIGGIIDTVLDELNPLASEMDVRLVNRANERLPALDIDREKIERVLYNLIDNAIKFTPGRADVAIRAVQVDGNGFVCVSVVDHGPGIPPDYRESLFDRFQQIEGRYARRRGSGLGLTYCKLAVEAHGGQIWIEDNPDGGSIFNFTLPLMRFPV